MIHKNPGGEGSMVQFYADNSYNPERLSNQLQFDLIAFMSDEVASTLDDKKKYAVYGINYQRLDMEDASALIPRLYYGPESGISKDVSRGDPRYSIGTFAGEIDSVKVSW